MTVTGATSGEDPAHSAPAYRLVDSLPDLIDAAEYARHPDGRLVRVRLTWSADGVDVLGDAFRPELLERLLEGLGPDEIEQMMCG